MRVMVWCENRSDFEVGAGLLDRLLAEEGPDWVREAMDTPEAVRTWHEREREREPGAPFFDVHGYADIAKHWGAPMQRGHFDGKRGSAGARMARTILALVGHLRRKRELAIDAVIVIWDMDGEAQERKAGLTQAREWASSAPGCEGLAIVYGCPDFEMEAWLLCGFEPANDAERQRLEVQRQRLGFSPVLDSHRLDVRSDHDLYGAARPKSAKLVLEDLVAGDRERRRACWQATALAILRERGEHNGLREYLEELCERLVKPLDLRPG